MTPWNIGAKLPTQEMMDFYKGKSEAAFITSKHTKGKPKKRNKTISKLINDYKLELEEIPFKEGAIRGRIEMFELEAKWNIDTFGTATML